MYRKKYLTEERRTDILSFVAETGDSETEKNLERIEKSFKKFLTVSKTDDILSIVTATAATMKMSKKYFKKCLTLKRRFDKIIFAADKAVDP